MISGAFNIFKRYHDYYIHVFKSLMSLSLLLSSSQYIDRNLYTFYQSLLLNINLLKRFYEFYNRSHVYIYNSKYFV